MEKKTILLVGNASHLNRGCEAIYLGTTRILKEVFPEPFSLEVGSLATDEEIIQMRSEDANCEARHFNLAVIPKSPTHILRKLTQLSGVNLPGSYPELARTRAIAALQIGGDNYSLDYGVPLRYMEADRYLLRRKLPVYLWGASVGPFEGYPTFKPKMMRHLSKLSGIFAREKRTVDYLADNGVSANVYRMADPAFLMEPIAPEPGTSGACASNGMIGINLSPLIARYATGGDLRSWSELATELVRGALRTFPDDVLLIPHVTDVNENPERDDHHFMDIIRRNLQGEFSTRVYLCPRTLSAPQTKHIIGQCRLFAGARTHATIAAFSTCVPTLSLAYSIKAFGINEDMYGHRKFCIPAERLTVESFLDGLNRLNKQHDDLRRQLQSSSNEAKALARAAGERLVQLLLKR